MANTFRVVENIIEGPDGAAGPLITDDVLTVTVVFSGPVTAIGTTLEVVFGTVSRLAVYSSGSGTSRIKYTITVTVDDVAPEGIVIGAVIGDVVDDPSAKFINPNLNLTGVTSNSGGSNPTIVSVAPLIDPQQLGIGESLILEVVWSEEVFALGPDLTFSIDGGEERTVQISAGDTTDRFLYVYQIGSDDVALAGITIESILALNPETSLPTVKSIANGRSANVAFTPILFENVIIKAAPKITGLAAVQSANIVTGNSAEIDVTFTEPVSGAFTSLNVVIGSTTVPFSLRSGDGTATLRYGYTIQASDGDFDGIQAVQLVGEFFSVSTNARGVNDFTPIIFPDVTVNFSQLVIERVNIVDPRNYTTGETITMEVKFDGIVRTNGGSPTLTVDIGGTDRVFAYSTGTETDSLEFTYVVDAADAAEGCTVTAADLSGVTDSGLGAPVDATLASTAIWGCHTNQTSNTYHILAMGQSNLVGRPNYTTNDTDASVEIWDTGSAAWEQWDLASNPTQHAVSGQIPSGNPAIAGDQCFVHQFALTLASAFNCTVRVIFAGAGGIPMSDYVPATAAHYADMQAQVTAAGVTTFLGCVWHQGESDSARTNEAYETDFDDLLLQLDAESFFTVGTSFFIAGEVGASTNPAQNGFYTLAGFEAKYWSQKVYLAKCNDLNMISGDEVHFDESALLEMGQKRYYERFEQWAGGREPVQEYPETSKFYTTDGVSQGLYVARGGSGYLPLVDNVSYLVVFQPSVLGAVQIMMGHDGASTSDRRTIIWTTSSNKIRCNFKTPTSIDMDSVVHLVVGQTYHVVMISRAGAHELWVNGYLAATSSSSGSAYTPDDAFQLGTYTAGAYFGGRFMRWGFWTRVLTPTEIMEDFRTAGGTLPSSPAFHHDHNASDMTPSEWTDSSGNLRHASILGGAQPTT